VYATQKKISETKPQDLETVTLPINRERIGEGGLRLQGKCKQSYPDKPLISVVTVVFNGELYLEETILSVLNQTYDNVEYIIIDGGSTDGTVDIIKKYEDAIDYWVSESDICVYDAMNKGITLSSGEWLNYMNGGDSFAQDTVLADLSKDIIAHPHVSIFYSDTIRVNRKKRRVGENDHRKLHLNHQSMIYKKELHKKYGIYVVGENITISDYIFFSSIQNEVFKKVATIIAIYDTTGMSADGNTYYKKACVDYIFGRTSWLKIVVGFITYRPYRKIKELFVHSY